MFKTENSSGVAYRKPICAFESLQVFLVSNGYICHHLWLLSARASETGYATNCCDIAVKH